VRALNGSEGRAILDVAGASIGGAGRFLGELDAWLERDSCRAESVAVVGRGQRLTSGWVVRRELATRGAPRRFALNNASFCTPGGERVVLLRNALHFASQAELDAIGFVPSFALRAQIPVIRALAHRADRIVVPCTAMAERVAAHAPLLRKRIVVRGHPVSTPGWSEMPTGNRNVILVPVTPAPYKNLDQHVVALLEAGRGLDLRVVVTATPDQLPLVTERERVDFVGLLTAGQMQPYWERARAIYYPTGLEAFGYPLAEARVGGRWIIARNTEQNREIAGPALAPYSVGDIASLREAIRSVLASDEPMPDPAPNDSDSYFEWLVGVR
jgi:hypothetical protein